MKQLTAILLLTLVLVFPGTSTSQAATNAILFSDDFERPTYPGDMTPWVALQGAWLATNANFQGASDATNYSFAYLVANWTNYSLQAQVQFSASNAYGGGLAGRLDPATGARYAAWIYPEQSPAGPALLRLIKFRDWTTWSSTPMALVSLPAVGTNWHTLNLAFQGDQIAVSFDGVQLTNVNDYGFDSRPAYSSGGISADTYTFGASAFIMSIDNAQVTSLAPVLLPLTVTANDARRAYGAANPPFTGTIVGLQPGDNISATYSTAAVTNSPVAVYQIVPTLNDLDNKLGNYLVTTNFGALTVTQAVLTVTADAKSKTYGATDPALTYQITSGFLVSGDSLTGALTRVSGENVGAYAIQRGSLAANANYSMSFIGVNFTISPASSATAVNSSMNPSAQGSNVTFTASVTPVPPATTTPTGNVQFYANGAPLGGLAPLNSGAASISTAQLPPGSNTVTAAYAGSGNFLGSTNSLVQVVSVIAQTPSVVGLAANANGTVTVTFQGTPGARYLVQAVSNLGQSAGWENVSTNTAGPDGRWTFTESMAAHAQRYYRSAKP
jgi:hypothetical protein